MNHDASRDLVTGSPSDSEIPTGPEPREERAVELPRLAALGLKSVDMNA